MEFEPEDQKIVDLLTRMKEREGAYPRKMLASRRRVFLNQMASIGAGLGIGTGIHTATGSSKGGTILHAMTASASTLVETALVIAIVVQAGVIAYTYRDRIIELVNSISSPSAPTTVSIPVTGSTVPEVITSAVAEETLTPVPTDTLTTTTVSTSVITSGEGNSGLGTEVVDTPQPPNDIPGNHYGQTPKPEITKKSNDSSDAGGDSDGTNGSGKKNNKP